MRILFLVSSMDGGGAERVAALLSNEWAAQGHQVVLMPTYSGRGGCAYPLDPGVRIEFLADATRSQLARTGPGRLLALRHTIGRHAPDVVVSFLTNVNVAAILASRGVPVVVSERIFPPLMPLPRALRLLRRLTYARADCVVMQTRQGLRWLERAIPGARGQVIGNPLVMPLPKLDPAIDPQAIVPAGRKLLLGVGRLDPQKNFALLIEGFARVASDFPQWHLVILGEGGERRGLEHAIARAGMRDRIALPGRVGDAGAWYERADAFALTSRFEGFPNALLEALGHAVPALSLDCPSGPADLLTPDRNGVLLRADADEAELAEGLRKLLSRDWRDASALAAQLRERYEVSAVAEEWTALFRRVIAARQVGSAR